jgi:hypothetical protein
MSSVQDEEYSIGKLSITFQVSGMPLREKQREVLRILSGQYRTADRASRILCMARLLRGQKCRLEGRLSRIRCVDVVADSSHYLHGSST